VEYFPSSVGLGYRASYTSSPELSKTRAKKWLLLLLLFLVAMLSPLQIQQHVIMMLDQCTTSEGTIC